MALDTKIIEWDGKGCQTVLTFCSIAEFVYALSILKYSFPHVIAWIPFWLVHEMEEHVKAKEKKKDQIVADENQKLAALSSEVEWKLKCLEPRERKVEETIAKVMISSWNFVWFKLNVFENFFFPLNHWFLVFTCHMPPNTI